MSVEESSSSHMYWQGEWLDGMYPPLHMTYMYPPPHKHFVRLSTIQPTIAMFEVGNQRKT